MSYVAGVGLRRPGVARDATGDQEVAGEGGRAAATGHYYTVYQLPLLQTTFAFLRPICIGRGNAHSIPTPFIYLSVNIGLCSHRFCGIF